ncbi:MAG: caspase family protein [Desulfuromonadales bacterium]
MKLYSLLNLFIAGVFSLFPVSTCFSSQRHSLIIGNSKYETVPLVNPENDSKTMAQKLRTMGFKVDLYNELSQKEMYDAIDAFFTEKKQIDEFLFFYAGHAIQVNGKNYLIPVDAKFESEDFLSRLFDVRYLIDKISSMKSTGVKIVILDACRDNPFSSNPLASSGLAEISAPSGTLIAFSTAPGKIAEDGEELNSPYVTNLLRSMSFPGRKIEDVFKEVRTKVKECTSGKQVPWEATSLETDFCFLPPIQPAKRNEKVKKTRLKLSKKKVAEVDRRCGKILMKLSLGMEALDSDEQDFLQNSCR